MLLFDALYIRKHCQTDIVLNKIYVRFLVVAVNNFCDTFYYYTIMTETT